MFRILLTVFLVSSLCVALSSCYTFNDVSLVGAQIDANGNLVLTYSDGSVDNLGKVVGSDGTDGEDGRNGKDGNDGACGSLAITADGSSIPAASAKWLRSAVSIVCNFTRTVQNSGYRPGMGGTRTEEYSSAGSGVIYELDKENGDAFIITNYHVVYDSNSDTFNGVSNDISVYLYGSEIDEKAIKATYVGGSLYYDIAVLRDNETVVVDITIIAACLSSY